MDKDISKILEGWDYLPHEITVRKITGIDGKEKIQMRLELGLLQMEIEGRPDCKKPYGKESLLEYYLSLIEEHKAKYRTDEKFALDHNDCLKLYVESLQYYYRYLCLFKLGEYEGVIRDTERNLQVFNLIKKYATDEEDIRAFEQYRPYLILMNTRARAHYCLERKDYDEALKNIENGISSIENFFKEYQRVDLIKKSEEITFLKKWKEEIQQNKPLTELEKLQKELKEATAREDYERCAELRDRIQKLQGKNKKGRKISPPSRQQNNKL